MATITDTLAMILAVNLVNIFFAFMRLSNHGVVSCGVPRLMRHWLHLHKKGLAGIISRLSLCYAPIAHNHGDIARMEKRGQP